MNASGERPVTWFFFVDTIVSGQVGAQVLMEFIQVFIQQHLLRIYICQAVVQVHKLNNTYLLGGIILCVGHSSVIEGYLVASLASTHWMPIAPPLSFDNQTCLQVLLTVPWG